ncbi:Common plant regulatory factor 1 [Forsythia ovata]|uniref:Common plant regulatory factor 1 n=1 Tax=Forsythia ovata TaxID=205694 RepID=A0ABD1UUN8_9LAMI
MEEALRRLNNPHPQMHELNPLPSIFPVPKRCNNATTNRRSLKDGAQLGQLDEKSLYEVDDPRMKPIGTVNLLSRVNNLGSVDKKDEENDVYEDETDWHSKPYAVAAR